MSLEAGFAAGRLDPALALVLETRAALTGDDRLARAEAAAGALFEAEQAAAISAGARAAVLARLGAQESAPAAAQPAPPLPAPLARAVAASGGRWRFKAPGMRALALDTGGRARAELLRIAPGHGAPMHTHRGAELTLVLHGAYHDGHRRYGPGDLSIAGPELRHRPVAETGEACYALAVVEGGLAFEGVLGLVQRLLGR